MDEVSLEQLVGAIAAGERLTSSQMQQLWDWERAVSPIATTRERPDDLAAVRGCLLRDLARDFAQFPLRPRLLELWTVWLPLAMTLDRVRRSLARPLVLGILGVQGTGKTTLVQILQVIFRHLDCWAAHLSLDDLYKTYRDRRVLQQFEPHLTWRGPPGTHDVALGLEVLQSLRRGEKTALPRFDKSLHGGAGDRVASYLVSPEAQGVVMFEGWFVGVRPIDPAIASLVFDCAPHPILTDGDRAFARSCNARLQEYLPLWKLCDRLLILRPIDYRFSKHWRLQAEHEAIAAGKSGMSDAEIAQFVEYFWKALHPELFLYPLCDRPDVVDWVVTVDRDRGIVGQSSPRAP